MVFMVLIDVEHCKPVSLCDGRHDFVEDSKVMAPRNLAQAASPNESMLLKVKP